MAVSAGLYAGLLGGFAAFFLFDHEAIHQRRGMGDAVQALQRRSAFALDFPLRGILK